jgi:phage terminase large subunit-like protein
VSVDADTKDWILTPADERAAAAGMRFDGERGVYVCDWIERHCCLYEGAHAGQPLELMPYQREFVMRLYSWVWWSDEWGEWVRRFRAASLWCSKKNGKSPFLAANGLYLTCGDGEMGQKVYTGAKNGDQAKISQRHAFAMVEQSPELSEVCKLNQTTMQVTHLPTRSAMSILTGDNREGQKAKEGLNGSVLIDECHVFDREMHERTSRAGISRKEPLNIAMSTAGDDPSSYGYERCQYGRQVNRGERDDPHFLHVEYSAPDKVRDSDVEERLEEFGRAANPAWGYIVKPSEFRSDWSKSKATPREVARFKQYRLNLWVGSTNQWLDVAGWEQGERSYTLEDLAGRDCFLGLDLSRTRDMTACVLIFPWPEDGGDAIRLWPMFWLPERTAHERDHLFPFRSWAKAGDITLIPGGVVNYSIVEDDIVKAVEANNLTVLGVYFDQTYAEEITQHLEGRLGCERTAVKQGLMTLTGLAKEFERRVMCGLVQHPGNRVMSWQVGHVEAKADANQNIRPVKPESSTGKSIDGVMAALDAMVGVIELGGVSSEPSISFL